MPRWPKRTPYQRTMEKVVKLEDGCWLFQGARAVDYGHVRVGSRIQMAHRIVYEHEVGLIPEGYELDHTCRNPPCVNPAHMDPVPHKVNTLRGVGPTAANAKKTHCPHGHPYDEANTFHTRWGRQCATCRRERNAARDRKRSGREIQEALSPL